MENSELTLNPTLSAANIQKLFEATAEEHKETLLLLVNALATAVDGDAYDIKYKTGYSIEVCELMSDAVHSANVWLAVRPNMLRPK